MENKLTKGIAKILIKTGKAIQKSPEEHGALLRNNVKVLQELSRGCDDPHLMFLSYFLGLYIDDVWCNIAMDSTSQNEIKDDDVRLILSSIGHEFVLLGDHLSKKDYHQCYEIYVNLVHKYFQWISGIKKGMGVIV